jgi:molybdopterin-guanine dinucleotide biosynthesis protein A
MSAPDEAPPALAAAILAGGRATRLGGANKAALLLGGMRIVDRQLAALREVADRVFIVATNAAPYADLGVRIVPDIIPNAGPLGGIYTAIVNSPCERTLVVGCDMPFLPAALLRALGRARAADQVIPRSARGYEPLCAVYGKRCAEPLRARIDRGDLQASVLPEGIRVEEIGPEALMSYDPHGLLFVNVNTPHDYERARSLIELGKNPMQDRITDERERRRTR